MKLRILSIIIICITCIFTAKIFINFQKRWNRAEIFQDVIINAPLFMRHLLIPPKQLGIDKWDIGDYAAYQLKTNTENDQIFFSVPARESGSGKRHWLRTNGLTQFNAGRIELWRLLSETSLLPGTEADGFFYAGKSFLFPLHSIMFPPSPILLQDLGSETIKTPAGEFKCRHYFARVRAPSGHLEPLMELWANTSVRPLGIVRARWRDETLDLVDVKSALLIEIPDVLLEAFNQNRLQDHGCAQCHSEDIGGKDLKFLSKYLLSSTELNLTEFLFHYHQTGLIQTSDPVHIQTILETGQITSREPVQFTWTKGSFWVKANQRGELTFLLDSLVSQEKLRLISRKGALVLNLKKR